ncbi:hypothetical protein [Bradyrhizobium sp. CCBAU 53421]|uniref:hypothetical protein n=1 Tax=Bradyrhizobium sp. CCBAU 53421 TaxID=1325120 RepID=UPI00188BD7BF|nr:hypothetical protein [Bradyrhizobium sp. CCBAU 53421]
MDLKGVGDMPRQATGFFWRRSEKVFLITNWHVVTGLNMMDGTAIGNHWVPERIVLRYFVMGASQPKGWRSMAVPDINLPLFEDFHRPYWVQHPMAYEWNADVVALDVTDKLAGGDVFCVNDHTYPRLYHFAGSEIFVLGHALPESTNAYPVPFPIWKRGSIASEIIVPWNMRPAFLIDSRTSKGMSGSPVFARVFGPAAFGDGSIQADNILVSEFMGIYSGRLFDDENNASVGLVWHRNLIDQLLAEPAPGSRDWKKSKSIQMFTSVRSNE